MDGVVREGERIPRRPSPEFEEVDSNAISGIMSGGILKVAMEDTNQFGPHAMIILLVILATVTGVILKLFSLF